MEPLRGEHAEEVAEIASREVARFARILADEIAATPMRADGNANARDLCVSVNEAIKRFERGEIA
jgi:hypothetical protein